MTTTGQVMHRAVRARIDDVTAGIFDFSADNLATADRILTEVTARVNAFLAAHATTSEHLAAAPRHQNII